MKHYLSLIKFSHTIFALPFAMIGFVLAVTESPEPLEIGLLIKVLLCMVFARSAAMAYNRYADHRIDSRNPRTAVREIPAGIISPRSAMTFAMINAVLFSATTWFINPLCFALSPIALLVILGYSLTKRFTFLCHLVLGMGLALAPIGAYIAVSGSFSLLPVLFSLAVLCWVSGFDIIYALQDESFDRAQRLQSIPVHLGAKGALRVAVLLHCLSAGFIVTAGLLGHMQIGYWLGSFIFAMMLVYQHSQVKPHDLSRVNLAFFTANGIASVAFAVAVIADLYFFRP